ncbi:MAG: OmpH family outer membrane protein [Bacteroidetes bacterium]|nr:OmpH family outer membrane protein [Bacteroidota bacterium]
MRLVSLSALLIGMATIVQAQAKIGYFSSGAIIKQMPEAQEAQKQLDKLVEQWQSELTKMQDEWKQKFDAYDKRKLIMTDQRRAEAEKELRDLDQAIVNFRNQKFGQNGELFNKQNELMKPVQDRIFKALQDVAKDEDYDFIFDKSGDILLMYTNEKYDLTKNIIEKLSAPAPSGATQSK